MAIGNTVGGSQLLVEKKVSHVEGFASTNIEKKQMKTKQGQDEKVYDNHINSLYQSLFL